MQLFPPSTRASTCISRSGGKLVSLGIPLTEVITALCPKLLPLRRLSIAGALGWEFQNEFIKTHLFSAEIMSYSNVKPLGLAWVGFTPIWAHVVPGAIYYETVGNWTFPCKATAVIHPQSYIDQILILFHRKWSRGFISVQKRLGCVCSLWVNSWILVFICWCFEWC